MSPAPPDQLPVFDALPGAFLLLTDAFVIEAVSDDYLAATLATREQLVGRSVFDAFPDNPAAPEAHATRNLRASLEHVLATGQPHHMAPQHYDVPDPARPGAFVERHWRCTNRPVRDAAGRVARLIHAAVDVTDQRQADQTLRESQAREQAARAEAEAQRQRFRDVLLQLPAQVAVNQGPDHLYELVNPRYQQLFPARTVLGLPVREALPELADQQFFELLDRVYQTGEPFYGQEMPAAVDYAGSGQMEQRYFDVFFQALHDGQGRIDGLLNFAYDVTEQVRARQQVEQLNQELEVRVGERTRETLALQADALAAAQRHVREREEFYQVFEQAPVIVALLRGPEHLVHYRNPAFQALFPGRDLTGHRYAAVMPEIVAAGLMAELDRVYATGQPYHGTALPVVTVPPGGAAAHQRYYDFSYQPYREADRIVGISIFAYDVTEQVQARQEREAQQRRLYAAFEQAPIGIAIQSGPDLVYEFVNPAYQRLVPGRQLAGRRFFDVFAEMAGTQVETLLRHVYDTGETQQEQDLLIPVARADGSPELDDRYFTIVYQARRDEQGTVNGILAFVMEVTEQVLARREREAQQQQLHELFMQAPAPIVILDGPELVFQLINPAYQRIFPGRDLLHKPLMEALPELVGTPIPDLFRGVYQTGEPVTQHELPLRMARHEGAAPEDIYWTFTYQARRDAHGVIDGVRVFAHDVTDQVRARRVVETSEQQVRALVESAPFPIGVYVDDDLRIQLANDAILTAWGKGSDVVGRRFADVLPELADQPIVEQLHHVRTTGEPLHLRNERVELVIDGSLKPFYFNYSFTPLRDAAGTVTGILNTAADVTDLALARERLEAYAGELQESEARFRTMADAAPNMVWAVHPDSTIRYVNRTFLDFVGLATEQEYAAVGWGPYIHPEELELTQQNLSQAIADRQPFVLEHRMRRHDGQYRWLLSQGAPSYLAGGMLYGYVGSAIDITDLKHANEQLTRTNVDLDNFIYTASHDLKAPITNIEGLLDTLRHELPEQPPTSEITVVMNLMQDSVERFQRTIDHLTEVTKLQKEHAPHQTAVDLAVVVEDVRLDLAPLLHASQAELRVHLDGLPPVPFSEKNLRSVVFNLLSNAVKYRHPDRRPHVDVRAHQRPGFTVLEVHDNGLGLAPHQLAQLFGMFQRFHNHVAGTGIGLYMVKRMVENAGGRLQVHSQLGAGTTFFVHLPH